MQAAMSRESLVSLVALVVSSVWGLVALAAVVLQDYTALSITTPVMLIVVGFLMGVGRRNGKNHA